MHKTLLESLVIIALVESSICQGAEMQQDSYKIIDTGAILSASQAEKATLARPMIEASPPFWTPSTDDVAQLERALPSYIRSANIPSAGKIFTSIRNYRRQYIGYTKDGEKWILVNGFCDEYWRKRDSWHHNIVFVFDGGACFCRARYNASKAHFDGLEINGES